MGKRWETAYLNSKPVKHLGKYLINLECRREIKIPPHHTLTLTPYHFKEQSLNLFIPPSVAWGSTEGELWMEQQRELILGAALPTGDKGQNNECYSCVSCWGTIVTKGGHRYLEGVTSTRAVNSDHCMERFQTWFHQHHLLQNLAEHSSSSSGLACLQARASQIPTFRLWQPNMMDQLLHEQIPTPNSTLSF